MQFCCYIVDFGPPPSNAVAARSGPLPGVESRPAVQRWIPRRTGFIARFVSFASLTVLTLTFLNDLFRRYSFLACNNKQLPQMTSTD